LTQIGVVHETPQGWVVTHFQERQTSESYERVKRYRDRYRNAPGNVEETAAPSTSDSESLEEGQGASAAPALPATPAEAMEHPDVCVFSAVTGRIPGQSQYRTVIETVRLLRRREHLDDPALQAHLAPYWLAWSSRKRLDGRPYDPGNITWLTEWALNGAIPPPAALKHTESAHPAVPTAQETRRMLDERDEKIKQAVPMPEELRRKMRGLKEKLAVKDGR
jgi:hypothetical protein